MRQLYTDTADPSPTDGIAGVVAAMLQSPQFMYRPEPATGGAARRRPHRWNRSRSRRASSLSADRRRSGRRAARPPRRRRPRHRGRPARRDRSPARGTARGRAVRPLRHPVVGGGAAWRRSTRTETSTAPGRTRRRARSPRRRACSSPTPGRGRRTLTTLLTAPVTFVDADLAAFYGLPAPAGAGFQRVDLDPARAAGLLTQGAFLADARQGRPDLAGRCAASSCAPSCSATRRPRPRRRHRRAAADGRPAPVDARALRPAHRRPVAARAATR